MEHPSLRVIAHVENPYSHLEIKKLQIFLLHYFKEDCFS